MDNIKPDYSNPPAITKKSKLPIVITVLVVITALCAGFFLFSRNKSSKPPEVAGTATVAPTPTPTPSPTPTIDKMSVKIQVLNGTGTPGQAAKVVITLKNAGYNPNNIKTGNASDNLTTSSISSKASFESVAADMKSLLSSDFPDIEISSSQLGSDNGFDIVITTGGKKFVATPTPTGSDTPTPIPTINTPTSTPSATITPSNTPTPS